MVRNGFRPSTVWTKPICFQQRFLPELQTLGPVNRQGGQELRFELTQEGQGLGELRLLPLLVWQPMTCSLWG